MQAAEEVQVEVAVAAALQVGDLVAAEEVLEGRLVDGRPLQAVQGQPLVGDDAPLPADRLAPLRGHGGQEPLEVAVARVPPLELHPVAGQQLRAGLPPGADLLVRSEEQVPAGERARPSLAPALPRSEEHTSEL